MTCKESHGLVCIFIIDSFNMNPLLFNLLLALLSSLFLSMLSVLFVYKPTGSLEFTCYILKYLNAPLFS
jgi:hypothetical protein